MDGPGGCLFKTPGQTKTTVGVWCLLRTSWSNWASVGALFLLKMPWVERGMSTTLDEVRRVSARCVGPPGLRVDAMDPNVEE